MMQRLLIPSIGTILFLSVFLYLSFFGSHLLYDPDTGYHIRTGELILNTHAVPKSDPYSFHSPPLPWVAHEWLSEVIMATIHRYLGLTGIVVFFAAAIAAVYLLLFDRLRADNRNIFLTIGLVGLVVASSTLHWLARPHILSLIFIVVFHRVLDLYQYRHKNYLYFLPLLMLAWVNLHGGYIVGLILVGIYLGGNLVGVPFLANSERSVLKGNAFALFLTLAGCLLTSLVNPYGYEILLFPLRLVSEKFIMDYIIEFWSPNFHGWLPFRYLLYLTIAIFALSKSKLDITELALILFFTHMSLYSARYIPLFALLVSPILIRHGAPLLDKTKGRFAQLVKQKSAAMASMSSSSKGYVWIIAGVLFVFAAIRNGKIHYEFDPNITAAEAVEFLKRENLKGNMFNNDTFGDYLIYAAWPQYRVFVDGRSDMYGSSIMKEYDKVMRPTSEWKDVLGKYNINWVFDGASSPLSTLLLVSQDWHLIYADKVANIFLKNSAQNQPVLEKLAGVKPPPTANAPDGPAL